MKKLFLGFMCLVSFAFSATLENQKIIDTVDNVGRYADEHKWDKLKNLFDKKVLLDYSSFTKQPATVVTPEEIIKSWSAFLPGFEITQHKNSNHIITKTKDGFEVHTDVRAFHFISDAKDGTTWIVEGSYDVEIKKVNDTFKVSKFKFNFGKTLGNNNLPTIAMEKAKALKAGKNKVEFSSEGKTLVGDLYLPKNFDSQKEYKTVIVNGSWTTVKEQMAGTYAQKLADDGFIALAFDYRSYGESQGDIRYYESPQNKIKDINNAADFLSTLANVKKDGIGVFGVCAGAGYALDSATTNPKIKAVVTAASWLHDGEAVKLFYGGEEGVQAKINQAQKAKENFAKTSEVAYIPTISTTDKSAAMYGNFDYYLNKNRGAIDQWSADKFAVMSWEDWLTYNPTLNAKNLDKPTLMIHSDGAVLPQYTKKYFNELKAKDKKLIWLDTELQSPMHQFKFYDNEKEINTVSKNASDWFNKYL